MADYGTDSLYRNTQIINKQYLDVLNVDSIDIQNTTTTSITVEAKHEEKPDLLAYELYGNANLWWVFALFNQDELVDPVLDFKTGIKINVPVRFS
jgi:prophage DNA circulation protein